MDKDMGIKKPTETNEVDKVGRPCKYESHVEPRLNEIYEWLKAGYTDDSIAESLSIGYSTWMKYKAEIVELKEFVMRARLHKSCLVMNAQFEKAKGIKEKVPKAFKLKEIIYDDKGKKQSEIERLEYGEEYIYVPPDVNAADLFLRNNDPSYKSAKSAEIGNITVNNFQLPQKQQELAQLDTEIQNLEALLGVDYKVIDEG